MDQLNDRADQALEMLNSNLPSFVMEIVQKILPQVDLSATDVEGIVRSLIAEFSDKEEKLEVYLCPEDLKLLKALGKNLLHKKMQQVIKALQERMVLPVQLLEYSII